MFSVELSFYMNTQNENNVKQFDMYFIVQFMNDCNVGII
jgi:hypothetical protein